LSSDGQKELPICPFPLKYACIQSGRDRVVAEGLLRVVGRHPTAVEKGYTFLPAHQTPTLWATAQTKKT
jgi:hypothetical protein